MSQTIDEKVVELRFDNKQFESGVKESLSTLTRLKEALTKNTNIKALDEVTKKANSINLSGLEKNVESLSNRFSTLGIVGMRVVENITDGLTRGLGGAIRTVTSSVISGGFKRAMNIENARFQLQGVLNDASKVEKVMNQASKSVDGTAYAFDQAANAASMFTASGVDAGDELMHALRGLAGATATFNADYQQMAMIWTKISGQGRMMGDELNQLSNKGMNAAVTIADFFNKVNDGSVEASDNVEKAIKSITKGTETTEADIRELVTKGKISFDIFSEAMSQTFGEHAKDANKTFEGSLANIRAALARTGEGIFAPLIRQEGPLVHLFNAVRTQINAFNAAFRATNGIVANFTKWAEVVIEKVATWIDNFKIANTWTQKFGDGTTKVFESATRSVQKWGDGTEKVVNRKLYTPFHALQDIFYTLVNIGKALLSVLKPIGSAFKDIFLTSETADGFYTLVEKLRLFSERLALSAKQSEQLKHAFTGLFKVIKSVFGIFARLINVIRPGTFNLDFLADGFFDLADAIGSSLEKVSDFIDKSPIVTNVIETMGAGINKAADFIKDGFGAMFGGIQNFNLATIIDSVAGAFDSLGQSIYNSLPTWAQGYLDRLQTVFGSLVQDISILDFSAIQADFKSVGEVIEDFANAILKLQDMKDAIVKFFDFSDAESGINKIMAKGDEFVNWYKQRIAPLFSNNSIAAYAGAGSFLWILIQLSSVLSGISAILKGSGKTLLELPKTLKSVRKALDAYTNGVNTENVKNVAIAIAILAGSIFALSLIKPERLRPAVLSLIAIGLLFVTALAIWKKGAGEATTIFTVMNTIAGGIKKALINLSKALVTRAIGKTVLDFAISLALIIGTIYAVSKMINDPTEYENFQNAMKIVGGIAAALLVTIGVMSLIGTKLRNGMLAFSAASFGILALVLSLLGIIGALKLLFDMKLPVDWEDKCNILKNLFIGIGGLILAFALANRFAGSVSKFGIGKTGLFSTKKNFIGSMPIIGAIGMLLAAVFAVKQLMDMKLPKDYKTKLSILTGIFFGIIGLLFVMALASRLAGTGGGLKVIGTIIALAIGIGAALVALKVLETFDVGKMKRGVLALAVILIALGLALKGARNINGMGAAAALLSMCLTIAVMVGAISFLSLFDGKELLKGAVALGTVLILLSIVLKSAGSIADKGAANVVWAMCASIAAIALSLFFLSGKDWKGLLAAAVSMGIVLLTLAKVIEQVGSVTASDPGEVLKVFAAGLVTLAVVALILYNLAQMPWKGMLAAGAAISAVMYVYAKVFEIINGVKDVNAKKVAAFLFGSLACIIIGFALAIAAHNPWKQILAAGIAIAACLFTMTGILGILGSVPSVPISGIASLIVGALACIAIGFALAICARYNWKQLLAAAGGMAIVLLALAGTMSIIVAVSEAAPLGVLVGLGTIIEALVLLAGVAFALMVLAHFDSQKLIGSAIALGIALLAVGITMAIIVAVSSITPGVLGAIGTVIEAIGLIWAVTESLKTLSECDPVGLMTAVIALTKTFEALEKLLNYVIITGLAAPLAVLGLATLNGVVADLGILLTALHELADADALKDGGNKLGNIGEAIGKFFGGIIEGIGERVLNLLPTMGTNLSSFMTNAKGFFDGINELNPDSVEAANTLVGVMMALTASDFVARLSDFTIFGVLDKLHDFIFGDKDGFAETLAKLGEGLVGFAETTSGIKDPEAFKTVTEAMGYLIDMTKDIPNSGGKWAEFWGDNKPDEWGSQLQKMGTHLRKLARIVNGVDFSGVETFTAAVKPLIQACNEIGNEGGTWAKFWGDNKPDEWGREVRKMATSFRKIDRITTGLTFDGIGPLAGAMRTLIKECNGIANSGGVLAWWVGDNTPDEWGSQVYTMAQHLKNIAIMVTGINFDGLVPMAKGAAALITATNNINPSSGMFGNSEYMGNWCDNLDMLGSSLYTFYLNTINVDTAKITEVATALQSMATALTTITGGKIDGTKVKSFAAALEDLATTGIDGFAQNITNGAEQVTTAVNAFIEAILAAIDAYTDKFQEMGKKQAEAYIEGLKSMYEQAQTTGKMLAMKAYSGLELQVKNFKEVGVMCAQGFANGLKDSKAIQAIINAATELGTKAKQAVKKSVNSESPSKDFMKIGNYCGEGLAIGMYQWANNVAKAGAAMGESAKSGLQLALENLNNQIDTALDGYPVITPMVDLTNVTSAADQINSMFNSALMRTAFGTSAASSALAGRVYNNGEEIQNGQYSKYGTNYTFVQNNNSPKALSRIDIYRDTKSLLKQYREAVEGV